MQPILACRCWTCILPPTKALWYEDNGIKCREFCDDHYKYFRERIRITGDSKEQVEALVVAEYLTYVE